MKKLMYLFVAAIIFAFTACGGGESRTEEVVVKKVVVCDDACQKSCCLGCAALEGKKKCIILEDGSMPCCIAKTGAGEESHGQGY
tara:strand:- start:459 stop:713 length:255 start_codon:yes stop_codon:yes gene_type:complete